LKKDYKGDKNVIRLNVSCLAEGSRVRLCSKHTCRHVRGRWNFLRLIPYALGNQL